MSINVYHPNGWNILLVTDPDTKEVHYRVLGTWSGSYLDGDSWRINSGITNVKRDGDHYVFEGNTGSIYVCHKDGYGVRGAYNAGIVQQLEEHPDVEFLEDRDDWMGLL